MFSKYRELGLSLIPLIKNGKKAVMLEWAKYCEKLPSEQECELWDKLFEGGGSRNIGLCLGSASRVIGVDLDSDDPRLLNIAPPSPVRKKGAIGETRFFKYSENIYTSHETALDILSNGSQTVLPPSIHPDTKLPYVWLTPDTLENFDINSLPELTLEWIPKYLELSKKLYPEKVKGGGGIGGRNNWLKDVVWAKRLAGESEEDIVNAVYGMDMAKNSPRLFTDTSENFKSDNENDALKNAWRFVNSVTSTFIKRGDGPVPQVKLPEIFVIDKLGKEEKKFIAKEYPEPKGILGTLYKTSLMMNWRHAKTLSLGGVIAIGSTIIANRFKLGSTWPNVYVLNVAGTGAGKAAVQDLAKDLLSREAGKEDLFGFGNYSSSLAITKNLDRRRERLDVIDEATSIFSKTTQGGSFQTDIDDTLCALFSSSKTLYVGPEAANRDGIKVWHPCVSALLSTTLEGLKSSISKQLATKGLFPRCLLFVEYGYSAQKSPEDVSQNIVELGRIVRDIRAMDCPPQTGNLMNQLPYPRDILIDKNAKALLDSTIFEWNERVSNPSVPEVERVFLTRAGEQASKLSLIHGSLRLGRIELSDVEWAIETTNTMRYNASNFFPQLAAENRTHSNFERVLFLIGQKGVLAHRELLNKTRYLGKRERNEILDSLCDEGLIEKTQSDTGLIWSII